MILNLCNSFRVLSVYNVTAKSALGTVHKIQLRDIHLHQPMLKSIEEKLGLPAKPKRPETPYFRYMNEVRASVQSKNPKLKAKEVVSLIAKMWRSLDANKKEKFGHGLKEDMLVYEEEYAKYKGNLSADDVQLIKETRLEQKERKTALLLRKKVRDLGRPKKPAASFIRFLGKQTDRQPKELYTDYVKRVSSKWNSLSDAEKVKYKPSEQEEEKYKKELLQWEDKMRKEGHFDVVEAPVEEPKRRSPKSSAK